MCHPISCFAGFCPTCPLLSVSPLLFRLVYYFHCLLSNFDHFPLFLFGPSSFFPFLSVQSCLIPLSLTYCLSLIPMSDNWPVTMNNGRDAAHHHFLSFSLSTFHISFFFFSFCTFNNTMILFNVFVH